MTVLRNKGSSLPIKITLYIKSQNNEQYIKYYLDDKEESFDNLRNFLINVKNTYISQLDSIYKENINLRFLYGKQFRTVMKHLENGIDIDSLSRYILNFTDNNKNINNRKISKLENENDWKYKHEIYQKNIFLNISEYISSLFENNGITIKEHYSKMRIIYDN